MSEGKCVKCENGSLTDSANAALEGALMMSGICRLRSVVKHPLKAK